MKRKILTLFLIFAMVFPAYACQKKKEPEKKAEKKKGAAGFLVNFKPNDSPDLIPPNSFYIQQSSAQIVGGQPRPVPVDAQNGFCLDVLAKEIKAGSEVTFELNYDPEYIQYRDHKPGDVMEKKGKPDYQMGLKGDQKGKLAVKVALIGGEASGSGKLLTLCFQVQKAARADVLFENGELLDGQKKKVGGVNWIGGLLWVLEAD